MRVGDEVGPRRREEGRKRERPDERICTSYCRSWESLQDFKHERDLYKIYIVWGQMEVGWRGHGEIREEAGAEPTEG